MSASSPTMVWCMRTWLSTLPSAYLLSSRCTARSTASLMAMPRLPVLSGCSLRIARPDSVSLLGLAIQLAPKVSMKVRR